MYYYGYLKHIIINIGGRKMENNNKCNEILLGVVEYKEKIIEMINGIEKENVLGYLCRFIELFLEKWG